MSRTTWRTLRTELIRGAAPVAAVAVAVAGIAAAGAFGALVGRLVPWRLVAPLAGGAVAALLVRAMYVGIENDTSGVPWLSPTPAWRDAVTYLGTDVRLLQLLWLGAVTVTLLAAATTRTWWRVALPAAVAAVAAVPIVTGPGEQRQLVDHAAQELVCAPGDGPHVCFSRVNAFLLDDVTEAVREYLALWEGVPGGYERAVDSTSRYWNPGHQETDGTAYLDVGQVITATGGLAELGRYNLNIYSVLAGATLNVSTSYEQCEGVDAWQGVAHPEQSWEQLGDTARVAYEWAGAHPWAHMSVSGPGSEVEPPRDPRAERLASLDEPYRKAWLAGYVQARETCDSTLIADLLEVLE